MKIKTKNADYVRRDLITFYLNKYYCLFMNRFKWSGDIDNEQKEFLMRQFWSEGTICASKVKGTEGSTEHPNGLLLLTPYAVNGWNIYDYPIAVNLINLKGVKFIPYTQQEVNKDVVLGFIARNHKGLSSFVKLKVLQIVDIEMIIRTNSKAHKTPFIIPVEPENIEKMREYWSKIESGEDNLFVAIEDADKFKVLSTGVQFILDKLHNYKACLENELREYLGLDNLGVNEKKEHLINSEIQANDEIIESSSNVYLDCLKEFCEGVKNVLGIELNVELNEDNKISKYYEEEQEQEDEQ